LATKWLLALSIGPSVTMSSTDFSFQNLVFWNLLYSQQQKSLYNQYLPHSKSKSYQINSIKSFSSISFQQHRRHIPIPPKNLATILLQLLVKKSFNIQELLHHQYKRHETKRMHPFLSIAFQRHQEHNLKHPGLVDLITTKQNYLPS
jgi:hypothetical protein